MRTMSRIVDDAATTRHGLPLLASAHQPVTDELVDALRDEEGGVSTARLDVNVLTRSAATASAGG